MKKISVEVEELLNPKLSLTQQIIIALRKQKNPITTNELYDLLPDYSLFQLLPHGIVERDPADPLANIFLFSNFVFILQD